MRTSLSRRRFLEPAVGSVLLLMVQGCGGGGGASHADSPATLGTTPSTTTVTPPSVSCGSAFDFNHGHVLAVSKSDLDSATDLTYNIQGSADHTHSVTLTVAQLGVLKTGASVTVTSTTAFDHHHVISILCA